jgi:hypothetical protein
LLQSTAADVPGEPVTVTSLDVEVEIAEATGHTRESPASAVVRRTVTATLEAGAHSTGSRFKQQRIVPVPARGGNHQLHRSRPQFAVSRIDKGKAIKWPVDHRLQKADAQKELQDVRWPVDGETNSRSGGSHRDAAERCHVRALACSAQPLPYRHTILQTYRDPHDVRRSDVELRAVMAPSRDNRARRRRFSDGMHEQRFTSRSGHFVHRRHAAFLASAGLGIKRSLNGYRTRADAAPPFGSPCLDSAFAGTRRPPASCRNADAVEPGMSESSPPSACFQRDH